MEAKIEPELITVTIRVTRAEANQLRGRVDDQGNSESPAGRFRRLLAEEDD